jgi:hypothetical protein
VRPEDVRRVLAGVTFPWWIAGGWALDLYLGVETAHRDLDVMALERDADAARATLAGCDGVDLVLDGAEGDDWVYARDSRVRRPLAELGFEREGLPVEAPEIVLLFKADAPERSRFAEVAPALSPAARAWLREALAVAHPGHAWIAELR